MLIPSSADNIGSLLDSAGVHFTRVALRQPLVLHILGRLQWAASVRLSASLREQRRRVLIGHRVWPSEAGARAKIRAMIDMGSTFMKFLVRSPVGTLIALFPPPKHVVTLVGKITRLLKISVFELPQVKYSAVILPSAGFEAWLGSAIVSLRSRGVKTILIPDNWDNLTSKNSLAVLPDYIVTLGQASAANLHSYLGIPKSIIMPIGIPKFSSIERLTTRKSNSSVTRVLFLGFSVPYLETQTLNSVHQLLQEQMMGGFHLVYKPHPARAPRSEPEDPPHDGIYVLGSKSRYALPELDSDYKAFLHSFDVVIAPPTTMVLEFLLAGRAKVVLDLTNDRVHRTSPGPFSHNWIHVRDLDSLKLASGRTPPEIADAVELAIRETKSQDSLSYVICPNPSEYALNLALLVNDPPPSH